MDELMPVLIVGILFIGLPGMIFHYVTQWKRMRTISGEASRPIFGFRPL